MRAENVKVISILSWVGRNNMPDFCFMGENQNQKNNKHELKTEFCILKEVI
jgi:hypothetical protein